MHRAVITLHGTVKDPEIPVYRAKVIGVRQGDFDLYRRPHNDTWTRLQATAVANDTWTRLQATAVANDTWTRLQATAVANDTFLLLEVW